MGLQPDWLVALLAGGRQDEARAWIRHWHWGPPSPSGSGADADKKHDPAQDLMWHLVEDPAEADIYDVFVDQEYLSPAPLDSPTGRDLAVKYVEEHGYPELAAYLQTTTCRPGPELHPASWTTFPAPIQAIKAKLDAKIIQAASSSPNCQVETRRHEEGSERDARTEIALRPGLRWLGQRPTSPLIPPQARAALSPFNIVRYSGSGDLAAAISLSQDVDPVGEVSGGGYWLHLSPDRGKTWRDPLYLGLQQYEPYEVVPRSHVPLIRGRVLQIEVEVKELDADSIMFPPVGIRTKRTARNIYIELSLDDIERDSDGDGLTDVLEQRLHTDPRDPDTDHDGLRDDVDPLPQVSATAPPVQDVEVARMALHEVFGYDAAAIGTGGPVDRDESPPGLEEFLTRSGPAQRGSKSHAVLFVEGDKTLFRGLTVPGRVVIVTAEEARDIRKKYGLFFPVEFHIWFNHAGTKATVLWSASWTGGTLKFEKREGRWQQPTQSGWIT